MPYPDIVQTPHDALMLVNRLFRDKTDKTGEPYSHHLIRTMLRLGLDAPDEERISALLHDVDEDTIFGAEHLRQLAFTPYTVSVVVAVSNKNNLPYLMFIDQVISSSLRGALWVKRADLADNNDPLRLARLDEPTRQRLAAKYGPAIARLTPYLDAGFLEQMILGPFDHDRGAAVWRAIFPALDYPLPKE